MRRMTLSDSVQSFLHAAGWRRAQLTHLPADFSTRRFTRLTREHKEPKYAILMQAAHDQKTPEFFAIAKILRDAGLSAPEIFAADDENGLVLMEDLGDTALGKLLDKGQTPLPLYRRAVDVLAHLHKSTYKIPEKFLPHFSTEAFTAQTELYLDHYFPHKYKRPATKEERKAFLDAWLKTLKPIDKLPRSLMLRDFMPDNLMNLPKRKAPRDIGLLDFQDGGLGPIAYDIASLCECVRRDVSPKLLGAMAAWYHKQNPVIPLKELETACRILSVQRHTRILGIVVRLSKNRPEKLEYLPRIEKHIKNLLKDKALRSVKLWYDRLDAE